jgi:hypothetical protein
MRRNYGLADAALKERYDRAVRALRQIAHYGHANGCMKPGPAQQCGCIDTLTPEHLAWVALDDIGEI